MDLGLKGKLAVVTASSKGLGLGIAEALAAEGANLVLCSRNEGHIHEISRKLAAEYGVETLSLKVDVSLSSDIDTLVSKTAERFGRVDALVCNAGGPPGGSFLTLKDTQWEHAFQTSLMSIIRLVRGFHPYLRETHGKVISIASSSVKVPIPGLILSNTFRTGVAGLMKTLSMELADDGILLNTICPGRIATDRLMELDQARAEREGISVEEMQRVIIKDIPLGRYGRPDELAAFAAFLLSQKNTYMTGSVYFMDGGMVKAM